MSKYFGVFDGLDLIGVHTVEDGGSLDPAIVATELTAWTGWPAPPNEHSRLRLVRGAFAWVDARTTQRKAADARALRDSLFAPSDRAALHSFRKGEPMPPAWAAYAQALADVPQQPGFPDSIVWPTAPGQG